MGSEAESATVRPPRGWWRSKEEPVVDETSELEAIRKPLLEAVRLADQERPGAAHMPQVGLYFRKLTDVPFEQFVNLRVLQFGAKIPNPKRKMVPFIQAYLADEVELTVQGNGTTTVKLKSKPAQPDAEPATTGAPIYQRSVWVAFIRPLPAGHRRFVKLGEHLGFTDLPAATAPEAGWLEVLPAEILGAAADEEVDSRAVHRAINAWLVRTGVSAEAVTVKQRPQRSRARLDQLIALIESLPPEVAATWQIPASVLISLKD